MHGLRLISVHIPKTAGTSFRHVLRRRFGRGLKRDYDERSLVEAACGFLPTRFWSHEDQFTAVHGHFPLSRYAAAAPDAKRVIWLRDPVRRIASLYHAWTRKRRSRNPLHRRFLDVGMTIEELAQAVSGQVAGYLAGYALSDFDFVGIADYFDEELTRFEHWAEEAFSSLEHRGALAFGVWSPRRGRPPRRNCRAASQGMLTDQLEHRLRSILSQEQSIYYEALRQRMNAA